jgi:histidine triad (HIT) family protein
MSSIFSKIIAGELPASFVYQDGKVTAFMDIQPVNPGHVLLIPNQEAEFLHELQDDVCEHLMKIAKRISRAIRDSGIVCEGINLLVADGEAAGQEVPHVHLHIFPRFKGDGFGLKHPERYFQLPPRSELDEAAEKIRSVLENAV